MEVAYYKTNDEALPHLSDVDIIYAAATGGGSKLAEAAPNLKWFCSVSAGVDPVLKPGVLPEGCLLSNSSGAYGVTIAEHLVMVTLMLLRRYPEYAELIRRHEWKNNLPLRSIKDSRVTIVGTGDIGKMCIRDSDGRAWHRLPDVSRHGLGSPARALLHA